MTSLYSINLSINSGEFETQFPAFLQSYGISPQQFAHTLATCNGIVGTRINAIQFRKRLFSLFIVLAIFVFMFPFSVIFIPTVNRAGPNAKKLVFIPVVFSICTCFFVFAASRHYIKKVRSIQSAMKQDLIAFLDEQNRTVYFPHQLQLLLNNYEPIYSSTSRFYYRNAINFVSIPRIDILSCAPQTPASSSYSLDTQPMLVQASSEMQYLTQNQSQQREVPYQPYQPLASYQPQATYQPLESYQTQATYQSLYQPFHWLALNTRS
jgi:hypothetical protein